MGNNKNHALKNGLKRIKKKHKMEIKAINAENMGLRVASLKKDIIINSGLQRRFSPSGDQLETIVVLARSLLKACKDLNSPSY